MIEDLRILFHRGTLKAPTDWSWSMVVGGSHCDGSGLKVSLRARVDASELFLERLSVGTTVKVSIDETRCNDMVGWFHGGIENHETQSVKVAMRFRFNLLSQILTGNGAGLALHESGWRDRGNNKVAGQNLEQLRANDAAKKAPAGCFFP
jgi:hypothetical protein